jgi:exonuclease VII small subunit
MNKIELNCRLSVMEITIQALVEHIKRLQTKTAELEDFTARLERAVAEITKNMSSETLNAYEPKSE